MNSEIKDFMKKDILNKSLNQLEGNPLTKRPSFDSYPVQKSYDLMSKKLNLYEPEDLRLMIGQGFGLKYLVPIAINILKEDPLIESNFFEGDLLLKVLNVKKDFWIDYPELKEEILCFFKDDSINYDSLDDDVKWEIYSAYEELTE